MTVEQLLVKLCECDPNANVVLEGNEETECFVTTDAIEDDGGRYVMLLRGKTLAVKVD